MLRALAITSMLLAAATAAGCSESAHEAAPGERERAATTREDGRPRAAAEYETIEVVNGGTITGSVTWTGERPEPLEIAVPIHGERCGETQRSPALAIGRRGGVGSTVVWLDGIRRGRAVATPEEPVVIAIEDCAFLPHVAAVAVGTRVLLRNAEPILHNVHAMRVDRGGRTRSWFSEGLPEAGATHEVQAAEKGIVRLVDDAGHPWMLGWLHAFDHPYFAVSDADGRFQLTGIPPGQYVVRAWHEGFRMTGETESGRPVYSAPIVLSRPVTVASGHDTTIDFAIGLASADAAGD